MYSLKENKDETSVSIHKGNISNIVFYQQTSNNKTRGYKSWNIVTNGHQDEDRSLKTLEYDNEKISTIIYSFICYVKRYELE